MLGIHFNSQETLPVTYNSYAVFLFYLLFSKVSWNDKTNNFALFFLFFFIIKLKLALLTQEMSYFLPKILFLVIFFYEKFMDFFLIHLLVATIN